MRDRLIQALMRMGRGSDEAAQAAMRGNVERDIDAIARNLVENEGFTYDPRVGEFIVPRAAGGEGRGLAVSVNPREREILLGSPGEVDPAELMRAYDDLVASGTLRPGINFGGYLSGESGRYAMDPSELIQNRRRAMRRARALDQEAVFDMGAPDWETSNVLTEALRNEFRNKDVGLQALAIMAGLPAGALAAGLAAREMGD